jgi:hypothetical protein
MLKLRPHHILDIVRNIGNERQVVPHEYGHLVHEITNIIQSNSNTECLLVVENDSICGPCRMLTSDNKCIDVLNQLEEPISKQVYNDDLDTRILSLLGIKQNTIITINEYLRVVGNNLNDVIDTCTHPKEDKESRRFGLINGLKKLKIENE